MSAERLPVPDPPETVWTEWPSSAMVDEMGRRQSFERVWVDLSSQVGDTNAYRRHRIEAIKGVILTIVVSDDETVSVIQYGDNPEAVRIDHVPFPMFRDVLDWALMCRDVREGRAA